MQAEWRGIALKDNLLVEDSKQKAITLKQPSCGAGRLIRKIKDVTGG